MTTNDETFTLCEEVDGETVRTLIGLVNTEHEVTGSHVLLKINNETKAAAVVDQYHYFQMTELDVNVDGDQTVTLQVEGTEVSDYVIMS